MRRMLAAAALVLGIVPSSPLLALDGLRNHDAWAAHHVAHLPPDIRESVLQLKKACGAPISAAHYFSVSINADQFISLHFENLWCPNREAVCNGESCLHRIYVKSQKGYRLAFAVFAQDTRLFNERGSTFVAVTNGTKSSLLRWDGRTFVSHPH